MSRGLSNKLAGQVGEFLVCAELGRRGFIATSFSGNVPEFDLIVADNSLKTLPVQVKTSRGISWPTSASLWINIEIDEEKKCQIDGGNLNIENRNLIYVCVLLAMPDTNQRDRFFILKKSDLQTICANNYREFISKHDWRRPRNFRSLDNRYYASNLEPYEDNWELFSEQLAVK
jgi:hypothetical protein